MTKNRPGDSKLERLIPLTKDQIERNLAKFAKEREKARKDLEKRAKPLYELVQVELFTVEGVESESYAHAVPTESEMRMGGTSPSYSAGYSTKTIIKVKPDRNIPVRNLTFLGNAPIRLDDRISAFIPRYEAHRQDETLTHFSPIAVIYTNREYKESEVSIEIRILKKGNEDKVTRIDRSIDYKMFKLDKRTNFTF